jgi:hypothetical protein
MFGKTRRGHAYYSCYPAGNNADRLDRYPTEHPKAIYVREDSLTEAPDHVIATRVFGPDRTSFLRQAFAQRPSRQRHTDATRAEALREQIDDLAARQDRLITELETTDPADRAFHDRLCRRFDTLEAERADKNRQPAELEKTLTSQPEPDLDLLDALPILAGVNITDAPERLQRKLYDALQLKIQYDRPDQARFRITLTDDTVDALTLAITGTARTRTRNACPCDCHPPGGARPAVPGCRGRPRARAGPQPARSSSSRPATGHAPPELFEITVCVRPSAGSCTLRNETPASYPTRITASLVRCSQKPRP